MSLKGLKMEFWIVTASDDSDLHASEILWGDCLDKMGAWSLVDDLFLSEARECGAKVEIHGPYIL